MSCCTLSIDNSLFTGYPFSDIFKNFLELEEIIQNEIGDK